MPITMREYQVLAVRTSGARDHTFTPNTFARLPVPRGPVRVRLDTAVLGLIGEVGEFADLLKKVIGHGHKPDADKFKKEGGDVFWYIAETAACFGLELEEEGADVVQAEIVQEHLLDQIGDADPYQEAITEVMGAAVYVSKVVEMAQALYQGAEAPDGSWLFIEDWLNAITDHIAAALFLAGLPLPDVLEANIAKLKERYPDGFSEERSINRTA